MVQRNFWSLDKSKGCVEATVAIYISIEKN